MLRYQTDSLPCTRALELCRLARRKHLSVNVCAARSVSRPRDPPSRSFRLIDVWRGQRHRKHKDRNSRTIKMRRHFIKIRPRLNSSQFSRRGSRKGGDFSWRRQVTTRPRAIRQKLATSRGRAGRRSFSRRRCRPAYDRPRQDLHPEPLAPPWPNARQKHNRTADACRSTSQAH
jgi:hypothetical protein